MNTNGRWHTGEKGNSVKACFLPKEHKACLQDYKSARAALNTLI